MTKRLRLRTSNSLTLDVDWAHETVGELQKKAAGLSRLKVDQGTGATLLGDSEDDDDALNGGEDHDSNEDDEHGAGESTAEYVSRLKVALKSAHKKQRTCLLLL